MFRSLRVVALGTATAIAAANAPESSGEVCANAQGIEGVAGLAAIQQHATLALRGSEDHGDGEEDKVAAQFANFMQKHGRTYKHGSKEYSMRLGHFKAHLAAVDAQNQRPDRLWTAGVNDLADRTPEELKQLAGYRRTSKRAGRVNLLGTAPQAVNISHLPRQWSWKGQLASMNNIVKQGSCGSCWAVSSATVLRAHSQLYQTDRTFSAQQILECTPNPRSCGGNGGCTGATAELAMEYVVAAGALTEDELAYTGWDSTCPDALKVDEGAEEAEQDGQSFAELSAKTGTRGRIHGFANGRGSAAFGMTGFEQIEMNKVEPLLLALYDKGPVVVSVGATSDWFLYNGGIMTGCEKEAEINHAVSLIGYGKDGSKGYWQIQNSWGQFWGEEGILRLLRLDHAEENAHCGWDRNPLVGTGCEGGPEKMWVCGQCGILSDSVIPTFTLSKTGLRSSLVQQTGGN